MRRCLARGYARRRSFQFVEIDKRLDRALSYGELSLRAVDKIMRVAWTWRILLTMGIPMLTTFIRRLYCEKGTAMDKHCGVSADERLAAMAWTRLAEGEDVYATALVESFGYAKALQCCTTLKREQQ